MSDKPSDPADKAAGVDSFRAIKTNRRAGGWTVERWIEHFNKNPYATAEGGVASMIIDFYEDKLAHARGTEGSSSGAG